MRKIIGVLPSLLLAAACGGQDPVPQAPAPLNPISAPSAAQRETDPSTAPTPPAASPQFTFRGSVLTTLEGDAHTAAIELVVTDELGRPGANVEVQGHFTGGIEDGVVLTTNADGIATAKVSGGKQHMNVGFAVTGVTSFKDGAKLPGKVVVDLIYPSPCCPLKTNPSM